jgi:hypothetical protein
MKTELYRDQFGIFKHDEDRGILELQWLDGSADMSEDEFKGWLERYASYSEKHRAPFLLIDVRQFKHRPSEHIGQWRDEHIIPRYNSAGVKKFAFLLPAEAPANVTPAPEGPATFPTGYFNSREKIEQWFAQ